ncbi:MAG: hypothetical protein AAGM46_28135, partial [Cyanobacteria bacterium J06582_2]
IAINNGPLTCVVTSINIEASSPTSGVSYSWSGPNSYSANTAIASVTEPGTYTVTVTNPVNGCVSTASTVVVQDIAGPSIIVSNDGPLTCDMTNVTISASSSVSGVTYSWSGPNGFTSNAASSLVSEPGTYTVVATNPVNGCTTTESTVVVEDVVSPGALASNNGPLTCVVTSINIEASSPTSGVSYSWSGPNSYSANTAIASVSQPGTYTVTVTNPVNGCVSTASTVVVQDIAGPSIIVSNDGPLTCDMTSVTISANSSVSGVTYSWSGPNGFTSNTGSATVTEP